MGGVGSLAVAVSTPALANALDDMDIKGPLRDSILLATSAAVGGAANGTTGAMNTTGQTANNFLNHEKGEIEALVDELLECQTEECQKDVAERYQELSDQNLQGLIVACGQESADCANDTRLQDEGFSIYEQYREELANSDQDTGIAVNILMAFQLEYGDEMTAGQEAHLEILTKEVFPDATPEQIATVVAMIGGVGKTGGNGKKTNVAGGGGKDKTGSDGNGLDANSGGDNLQFSGGKPALDGDDYNSDVVSDRTISNRDQYGYQESGDYVGSFKRPEVSDPKLKNIVNDIYKGDKTSDPIGTGSTADAARWESNTGELLKGKDHLNKKIPDYTSALNNWLKRNPNAFPSDRHAAQEMLKDLSNAASGKKNL